MNATSTHHPGSTEPDAAPPGAPQSRKLLWAVLAASLATGLAAALLAMQILDKRNKPAATAAAKTVRVVVADKAMAAGTVLNADLLAIRPVPVDFAAAHVVKEEVAESLVGKKLAYAVEGGEQITAPMLQKAQSEAFSARVATGRRAVTLPVDEISSISGLLEPGDRVDLLTTSQSTGQGPRTVALVLQNLLVMATGQRSVDDPKTGEVRRFTTVTLDLTVQDAAKLVQAREGSRLTALLRNRADQQPVPELALAAAPTPAPVRAAPAERKAKPVASAPVVAAASTPAAAPLRPEVQVFIGGTNVSSIAAARAPDNRSAPTATDAATRPATGARP